MSSTRARGWRELRRHAIRIERSAVLGGRTGDGRGTSVEVPNDSGSSTPIDAAKYRLTVRFYDVGFGGSAYYEALLTYQTR